MGELILKAGKERSLFRRHPWLFEGSIAHIAGRIRSGDTVTIVASDGRRLARAAWSPESQIRARVWSFDAEETIDDAFFKRRVAAAAGWRRRMPMLRDQSGLRLLHGESDGLPGVIADQYDDTVVLQLTATGADKWRKAIVGAIVQATGCARVYERSDSDVRGLEGLGPVTGWVHGEAPADDQALSIVEYGVRYGVDVVAGHKTGFYLDQRENRRLVRDLVAGMKAERAVADPVAASASEPPSEPPSTLAIGSNAVAHGLTLEQSACRDAGPDVLNCFCYTGGFSLQALAGGAGSVLSIDSSAPALAGARRNLTLNPQLPATRAEWLEDDVFEALRRLRKEGRRFDFVILDPPKFAPSAAHAKRAARAYKDINLLGFRLLKPGGLLMTYSCSGGISPAMLQEIVAAAAVDAGVEARIVQRLSAAADHPVGLAFPEGEYLKGLLLQIT